MKEKLKDHEKDYIYILKGLAIFCVVCAHSTPLPEDASTLSTIVSEILNYLGTMGVPCFFLVSGYLFDRNKRGPGDFGKRKFISVILPWLFCETLLWLYVVLRKGNISLKSWGLFLIGYEHTTYYLTVLMVFYVVFWALKKDWMLYFAVVLSVGSMICTGWQIGLDAVNEWTGTFYLNPLNWSAFFAAGMLLNRKHGLRERCMKVTRYVPLWLVASSLYFGICTAAGGYIYYFSKFAVLSHAINILLFGGLALYIMNSRVKKCLVSLGKYSFSIYLLHQFVAGIVVALSNRFDCFVWVLLRPLIIIGGVVCGIWCLKWINKKCSGRLCFLESMVGIRG